MAHVRKELCARDGLGPSLDRLPHEPVDDRQHDGDDRHHGPEHAHRHGDKGGEALAEHLRRNRHDERPLGTCDRREGHDEILAGARRAIDDEALARGDVAADVLHRDAVVDAAGLERVVEVVAPGQIGGRAGAHDVIAPRVHDRGDALTVEALDDQLAGDGGQVAAGEHGHEGSPADFRIGQTDAENEGLLGGFQPAVLVVVEHGEVLAPVFHKLVVGVLVGTEAHVRAAVERAVGFHEIDRVEHGRRGRLQVQLLLSLVHRLHVVDLEAVGHRAQARVAIVQRALDGLHVVAGYLVHGGHEVAGDRRGELGQVDADRDDDDDRRGRYDGDVLSALQKPSLCMLVIPASVYH